MQVNDRSGQVLYIGHSSGEVFDNFSSFFICWSPDWAVMQSFIGLAGLIFKING